MAYSASDIAQYFTENRTALPINDKTFKEHLEKHIEQHTAEAVGKASKEFNTKNGSYSVEPLDGGLQITKSSHRGSDSICMTAVNNKTIKLI